MRIGDNNLHIHIYCLRMCSSVRPSFSASPDQTVGPMALIFCIYMDSMFPLEIDSISETVALPHVTASRLVAANEYIDYLW